MSVTAEKTSKTTHVAPKQGDGACFFRKAEEPSFFKSNDKPSFFSAAPVQAKLSVSTPDDPHEKEADQMADHVMRMAEPAGPVNAAPANNDDEVHRKEEEHEIHAKSEAPAITSIQCKHSGRGIYARLMPLVQRSASEEFVSESSSDSGSSSSHADTHVSLKSMPLCRSPGEGAGERGPPAATSNFESALTSSKGHGSALPGNTLETMNSRFNTDFSNVRIHTGTTAESLSSSISAQAFTHGSDIYFNTGKFQPGTESGGHLLAHELTHTIQQGSVPQSAGSSTVSKKSIQRQASDRPVPSQLNNAVSKAKGEVGKVNANETGPDGFRTGWPRLIEYFKTTLGSDKVVPEGQQGSQGSVSEGDIKKERKIDNALPPANPRPTGGPYSRDAMPSWCGIFAFWALHKGGVPIHRWELGGKPAVDINAAYPPGYTPKAGDIAYRNAFSHYALVEKASGDTVTTINGNTSGENNLGAQIQVKDHPLKSWTAFFDPLMMMDGQLGTGEASADEKPKTLKELRQELFHVNRKEETDESHTGSGDTGVDAQVQAKPELSNWSVNANGSLTQNNAPPVQAKEEPSYEKEEQPEMEAMHETHQHEISRKHDDEHADSSTDAQSPGVQLRVDKKIQCSWFDSALSVINSAVDYVSQGLEAGKRLLLGQARDFAMAIPGYKALRVVLGEDPITNEVIDRNGHNFIEAAFDIMPGGQMLHDKLEELGALTEAEQWVDTQINNFVSVVHGIENDVEQFWNKLSLTDLAHPTAVFERIGNIIHNTINSVITFAVNAATELLAKVKHYLLTQLVSFIKEQTPAYPLLCVILGKDPVTDEKVDRNGTNILNALLELGGDEGREQRRQMQDTGSFQKVANYIDRGIHVFGSAYDQIKQGIAHIWDYVTIEHLMHPVDTFNEIYETFSAPVRQVWDFVKEVGTAILKFIKEVLLVRLSTWAKTVRGYFLVTVIIGEDPFTQANVPRNVENIIHGFMSLMDGGEEQFNQMKETGAIDRATQRINAAVETLNMTPESIIQLFTDLWHSMSLNDLIHPIDAFHRIMHTFGEPIGRLIAFVIEIIKIVLDIIMQVMNFPIDLIKNIITKAMLAVDLIKKDPIGFLKNLLKAIKQGFVQFFNNILNHLLFGLTGWLMSELKDAGVPELKDTSLKGVITWVLAVLDISMETIWRKLAEHPKIGPQKVAKIRSAINTLEGIWTFIKDVQERGMAAIWDKIKEQLTNLWDTVLNSVKSWVMEQIVNKVTAKLLSMLDPTGIMAVINSAIALYKAIQSFLKYLREMLQVVNSFVEGVVEIASGNTQRAADFLENSLHRAMPVVIGFLANQVGLGGIGHQIGELIKEARAMVDEAITWLINKAVELGGKLLEMGKNAVNAIMNWWQEKQSFSLDNGEEHEISVQGSDESPEVKIASSTPMGVSVLITNKRAATPAPTPAEETVLKAIEAKNDELIKYIKDNRSTVNIQANAGAAADAQKAKLKADVDVKLNELIKMVKDSKLLLNKADEDLPVTPMPTYGPVNADGFGTSMEVKPLTKLGTTGTPVNADNPVYTELLRRKRVAGGTNTYYVAGHLLNNNVHGDGTMWANLTPLANTANGDHEEKVEADVKKAVEANFILSYKVEVDYTDMKLNDTLMKAIEDQKKLPGADVTILDEKKSIIGAEAKLPNFLKCTVATVDANGNKLTAGKGYDSKYNFYREVSNKKRVDQSNLNLYYLNTVAGTVFLKLDDLTKAADAGFAGNKSLTWGSFYGDPNNKPSIDHLGDAEGKQLKDEFGKKQLYFEQIKRIEEINDVATLAVFKGNRPAYANDALLPGKLQELETAFKNKVDPIKTSIMNNAMANAAAITNPNELWGPFRTVNKLHERDGLPKSEVDEFKKRYFDTKLDSLQKAASAPPAPAAPTAPAPASPAAPPPSGPTSP